MVVDFVSDEAVRRLGVLVSRSRRTAGARFEVGFVRREISGSSPPLARLLRGGEVRLKLFLVLALKATRSPYEIKELEQSSWLAVALGLDDPHVNGARRVNSALRWLASNGFIERQGRQIKVLYPASTNATARYVKVPVELWSEGWLVSLSSAAIAVLIVLREVTGGRGPSVIAGSRKDQYELSDETWAKGIEELERAGLGTAEEVFKSARDDEGYDSKRRRLEYQLIGVMAADRRE